MTQQEAEVILKVNDQQAREKLDKLEAQAAELRAKFADAFKRGDTRAISEINQKLQKVNKEINNMRTNAANIRAAMVRLNEASPRDLQRTIKMINNELNSGRVKRGTKEWDDYVEKLKEVKAELKKVKAEMSTDESEANIFDKIKDGINDWGATAAAAMSAFAGVVMSGKTAVQTYADMEAEEANVRKFTGMTADEVARLNEEFKKLDTRTAREDLNKLAQEAGRLGKTSVADVLGFVKAADKINVALDDLGDGATLTLSKLTGIFGDEAAYGTEQSLLKVGSVINELSQNCSASAPYLAEFSSRLGGIAAQSKMTISQVMAFAAVLDTQNLAVEASATAVGQLITKIYQEPAKIAKATGLEVEKFSKMVKTDMNGALIMLFDHLNKFGGMENLASVFDAMGTDGARAIPVLSALAGHIEELKWQQDEANKAFVEGISVTNEFNVQNNTVEAQLDKARKGFTEIAVTLGQQLLPVMSYCISGTSMLMRILSTLITFFIKHRTEIITLTAAIIAYNVAITAAAAQTKLLAAAQTAWAVAGKTVSAIQILLTSGIALLTGNVTRATAAWRLFNIAIKTNPIALAISAIVAGVTALVSWASANKAAAEEERRVANERKKAFAEAKKGFSDIADAATQYASKEVTQLKKLYEAATNIHKSQKKRIEAAEKLKELYPNTFSNLTNEAILAGKAADAYLALAQNIKAVAKAEAARDKMKDNVSQQIGLEMENDQLADQIAEKERQLDLLDKRIGGLRIAASGDTHKARQLRAAKEAYATLLDELAELDRKRAENADLIVEAEKANDKLQKIAENAVVGIENLNREQPALDVIIPETEEQRRKREKAEREAARQAREALKKDLDERKAAYLQAEAENLTMYVTGKKNYADYCAEREKLERDYVDDVVQIHLDHNKLDIAAYGAALKEKAQLQKRQQDAERKRSLAELEKDHTETDNKLVAAYWDANSPDFQNARLLNQMLFQEDQRYLQEKAKIYLEGSEERAAIEREIAEKLAQDQLDKQKETAQAYMQFEQQYRQASGSRREQMEMDLLKRLYDQGLISEQEYQKALRDIKDKSRDHDIDNARKVQSEYADMVVNLYTSFSDFFSNLGTEGSNFWDDLAKCAQAAFAVMGAALSQYSAYSNAERDLELAKLEKRYDNEIKAAGKNEKKKKKLEEQKEAEVAKVKKKYNDKAMKIEIAQAVAQTAMAAIAAYASAAAIPKVGWIMAPIAAGLATAAGMMQIATIKKQHEAEAAGYYEGGFTSRDPNNRKEVGVVHANEFVANHDAVANPALAPVLRLIDHAQRNNTVGSLTAADVSQAIGTMPRVGAGGSADYSPMTDALSGSVALMADITAATRVSLDRLSDNLENGIESFMVMDGPNGFDRRYEHYKKLKQNPKR